MNPATILSSSSSDIPAWVADAVFYQIFPDRFAQSEKVAKPPHLERWESSPTLHGFKGGDLIGISERLDHLVDLGITALYLTPIFQSASNHRYHTFDYFTVDPLLGGNPALRLLLDAAHQRGLRVVLDGVFNHASRGFFQFHHVLENGKASPYRDWFHFNQEWLNEGRQITAYPEDARKGHSPTKKGALDTYGYEAWWDLPALPKFNTANPDVREFLLSVAKHWIEFGIDGWRLDVPNEIDDDDFWRTFRKVVKKANPDAYIVGEIWGEAGRWLKGDQFDAVMNYLLGTAVLGFALDKDPPAEVIQKTGYNNLRRLSGEEFQSRLQTALSLYPPAIVYSQLNILGSHDTPRLLTVCAGDVSAVKLGYGLLFTLPGAPCLYYGDEIGMEGNADPDCRRAFPKDSASGNQELRAFVKTCIATRKSHTALRQGSISLIMNSNNVFAFLRESPNDLVVVFANRAHHETTAEVALPSHCGSANPFRDALTGATFAPECCCLRVTIPARTIMILTPS